MVIKKYTKQDLNNKKRQRRLDAYTQQAKVYRKTATKNSKSFSLFTKCALSALIPLAAANTLNAQCQGGTGVVTVSGSFSASRRIDVDGDGNDDFRIFKDGSYSKNTYTYTHTFGTTTRMSIRSRKALKIDPQNGWSIKGTFFEASRFGATTITRGQANFASNDIGILCESDQYGPNFGQFCGGNQTGFLAVRKGNASTGLPGWIQIRVISLSQASASFEVLEMGIENSMGDNSATTGDCASLSNTLLPVELAYLESTPEDQSIRLNWETLSELNNTGFEVQRSTDGRHFSKIAWVEGQGTSNKNHLYSFKDEAVKVNTTYYYRLRQLDEDGTETFSPVRNTMIKDEGAFVVSELFPNPSSRSYGFAMFNLSVPSRGKVDMEVYNIQGQLIKSLSKDYVAGKNTISVPVNDLTEHQYFVKFQMGDEVVYRKLLMN